MIKARDDKRDMRMKGDDDIECGYKKYQGISLMSHYHLIVYHIPWDETLSHLNDNDCFCL